MAIAVDATSIIQDGGPVTSVTVSHTCSGSNRLLLVGVFYGTAADNVTGVTYNGVAMTQLGKQVGTFGYIYLYGLIAPDTGAHNIVASASVAGAIYLHNASYTGVKQTGLPDASSTTAADPGGTLNMTVTTVAANCWIAAMARLHITSRTISNAVNRTPSTDDFTQLIDTNAAVAAGSNTMTMTTSSSSWQAAVTASFAPAAEVTASPISNLLLMGAG